jgi:transcriptional regulator with XRE-family HTH domain
MRKIRKERGTTQKQLADFLKVKPYVISRLETGRYLPSAEFVDEIATALGRTTYDLTGGEELK